MARSCWSVLLPETYRQDGLRRGPGSEPVSAGQGYTDTQRQALDKLVVTATLRLAELTDTCADDPFDDDKPKKSAASSRSTAMATPPPHAALGLHALQHRGQEAAGIVSFDGTHFHSHRAIGLIGDTFSRRSVIEGLPGHAAIGHSRYSTTGASMLRNVQPLFADFAFGGLAVGHNGNLTNAMLLRRRLVEAGSLFQSTSDTEVIVHLIARSQRPEHHRARGRRAPRGRGRLVAGRPVRRWHHRRPRPAGRAPAGAGPARRGLDPGLRDLCPGHHWAPISSATSSPARSW